MKLLVVDDEPLARERLKRLVQALHPGVELHEAANGAEAIAANEHFEPDIVLLDIRMPGMDGIEAARHMTRVERPPAIIFCTAYEEYALAAFESRAVGYLLKPVQREKLEAALANARASTRYQLSAVAEVGGSRRRFLSSRSAAGTRLVALEQIRLLMADHKYVTAHFPGGTLLLDESLRELEQEFPDSFMRVHRNALVALAHVRGMLRRGSGEFVLELDGIATPVQISRRHLAEVREILEKL
jgi:two-component system, LytTR family, response regulator AlgR